MKHHIQVHDARVAYLDDGDGPPLLLLHGCPFSSYIWRHLIPLLRERFRCIAPDLLGLGDTETPPGADWSQPAQAATVVGLLDALRIDAAHVVAHDHGAPPRSSSPPTIPPGSAGWSSPTPRHTTTGPPATSCRSSGPPSSR